MVIESVDSGSIDFVLFCIFVIMTVQLSFLLFVYFLLSTTGRDHPDGNLLFLRVVYANTDNILLFVYVNLTFNHYSRLKWRFASKLLTQIRTQLNRY